MEIRPTAVLLTALATFAVGATRAVAADPTPAASPSGEPSPAQTATITKSGLQYKDIEVGKGPMPKNGQTVAVNYTARIGDKRIEASPPSAPFEFKMGADQAMKGLEEGVSTMKVGGKRQILVPPDLGYGKEAAGEVPPNSIVIFDVELVRIK